MEVVRFITAAEPQTRKHLGCKVAYPRTLCCCNGPDAPKVEDENYNTDEDGQIMEVDEE